MLAPTLNEINKIAAESDKDNYLYLKHELIERDMTTREREDLLAKVETEDSVSENSYDSGVEETEVSEEELEESKKAELVLNKAFDMYLKFTNGNREEEERDFYNYFNDSRDMCDYMIPLSHMISYIRHSLIDKWYEFLCGDTDGRDFDLSLWSVDEIQKKFDEFASTNNYNIVEDIIR